MKLKDFVERTEQSDRLIVVSQDEKELYRGYVGNFHGKNEQAEIQKVGIYTEMYKRGEKTQRIENVRSLAGKIPLEKAGDYKFSDLKMEIYTRVILKNEKTNSLN